MTRSASHPSRKLTLLIPGLTGGGAERVIARMANHWAAEGDRVTLITLSDGLDDVYRLSDEVQRVALGLQADSPGLGPALLNNYRRTDAVQQAIQQSQPDAVISFIDQMNITVLLATIRRSFPVIVSERIDTREHPLGVAWNTLRQATYLRSDALVVQTEDLARHFRRPAGRRRIEVIPNGVDTPRVELLPMPRRRPVIVAAGRLVEQKGFDILVQAFARMADHHPAWNLEIYGRGPMQAFLERLIEQHGLESRIRLCGWTDELESVLARSAVFALSSRYEGFPNVLLQAMSCGAACVSFDCPSGPKEIIRDARDGLLVERENIERLAAALDHLMGLPKLQGQLGNHARQVVKRFSYERYFTRWDTLLAELIRR